MKLPNYLSDIVRDNALFKWYSFKKYRTQLSLPDIDKDNICFKPAETEEEFTEAFRILHDCYVEKNFMRKEKSGMRVIPFHLLPSTVVLVAKKENKVIGTISIIVDSAYGLPTDSAYDLNSYRKKNLKLAELSSLAIHPDFRGSKGDVFHRIMRYAWKFSRAFLNVDKIIIIVNPSMNSLYESIYLFQQLKGQHKIDRYEFANGAPGVGLINSVHDEVDLRWKKLFSKNTDRSNFYKFINTSFKENEFHYISEFYSYFSHIKPQHLITEILTQHENLIQEIKDRITGSQTAESDILKILARENSRYNTYCRIGDRSNLLISNVSKIGFKIKVNSELSQLDLNTNIRIHIGEGKSAILKAQMVWQNKTEAGYLISEEDKVWHEFIKYLESPPYLNKQFKSPIWRNKC